jgi:hypothetical protein
VRVVEVGVRLSLRIYPQARCGMEITKTKKRRDDVNNNFARAARVGGFCKRNT